MNNIDEYIIITCPHCGGIIQILKREFNCKIFRHGAFKNNGQQIHPHLPKKQCDILIENNLIFGCGKPYKIVEKNEKWIAEKCDYV